MPIVMLSNITAQTFYAQYERGKLTLSGEMQLHPIYEGLENTQQSYFPMRGWYGMGGYHLTSKLTVGAYYSHQYFFLTPDRDKSNPMNYQQDRVVNARFDINRFFYVKAEGHFLDGTAFGIYAVNNRNGVEKNTNVFVARLGFAF